MSVGDRVTFRNINSIEMVVSENIDIKHVQVMYFDSNNILRKEIILKSLLR
jgi:hypothetical protein